MNQGSDQADWQPGRITIVGVGLLGGSVALAARRAGFDGPIVGVGRRQVSLDAALRVGCIDEGMTELQQAVERPAPGADGKPDGDNLVIIATPLGQFDRVLAQLGKCNLDGVIVTDVGSVKTPICQAAHEKHMTSAPWRFVGAHPMAGSEKQGVEHADGNLLAGKICILTPTAANEQGAGPACVDKVRQFWTWLDMRLTTMAPDEHDRQAAAISHLPHAVASLLMQHAVRTGALPMASTGLRDTTRLASGDPTIWTDIFTTNRQPVLDALADFGKQLADLRDLIDKGTPQEIHDWLSAAKADRDDWVEDPF